MGKPIARGMTAGLLAALAVATMLTQPIQPPRLQPSPSDPPVIRGNVTVLTPSDSPIIRDLAGNTTPSDPPVIRDGNATSWPLGPSVAESSDADVSWAV